MKKIKELLFLQALKGIGKVSIQKKYSEILKNTDGFNAFLDAFQGTSIKHSESEINQAIQTAEQTVQELHNRKNIYVITVFDEEYPINLNVMKNKRPLVLYAKGDTDALHMPGIAIVGTREPSQWTKKVGENLVNRILKNSNLSIISGLAAGCDHIAHQTAVNAQKTTVAVLPTGLENIYPPANKGLANDIIQNGGCLVTEYGIHSSATKSTFIERDGVVAALSAATLVLECRVKSGTMHTVDYAESYKRIIACYKPSPKDTQKGMYDGNAYILKEKSALGIATNDDVVQLIKTISAHNPQGSDNKQISFFDL